MAKKYFEVLTMHGSKFEISKNNSKFDIMNRPGDSVPLVLNKWPKAVCQPNNDKNYSGPKKCIPGHEKIGPGQGS